VIYQAKQVSVSIKRSVSDVYEFASKPENLPKWANGLSGSSIVKSEGEWIADSPMGKVRVRFVEKNKFGVLDHDVTLPSGQVSHNPLRIVKNGNGSEVIFTLYRLPDTSETSFEKDTAMVQADLQKLKLILEN